MKRVRFTNPVKTTELAVTASQWQNRKVSQTVIRTDLNLPLVKRGVAGSNIFVGCSISRKIEASFKIDQGRSLCMYNRQGCLSCQLHQVHLMETSAHPRGFPTIHLSKSTSIGTPKSLPSSTHFFLQTLMATFVTVVVSVPTASLVSVEGGGILATFKALSMPCREFFSVAFATGG